MRIELTVDGKYLALSVSSDKPLDLLLEEDLEIRSLKNHCRGRMCGNCIVLVDGRPVLSCLVPSFSVRGTNVVTYDSFSRTRDYRDIEKAYASVGAYPCQECYASRTLLIEGIVRRYEMAGSEIDEEEILQEAFLVDCSCLDSASVLAVVRESIANRRKRKNVRRA